MKLTKYFAHHKFVMGALIAVVVVATAVISRTGGTKTEEANPDLTTARVSLLALSDYQKDLGYVSTSGTVESLEQAEIKSQASAPVSKVNVSVGSKVSAGQILVTTENRDSAASLQQAQATLSAQDAQLAALKRGLRTEELAVEQTQLNNAKQSLEDTKHQQDVSVANAQKALFNTGLEAVLVSNVASAATVTISGTYNATEPTQYKVRLYQSAAGMRYESQGPDGQLGSLELGKNLPLGRGLYIMFSALPASYDAWTVSVPNTLSANYTQLKNGYDAAVQGRTNAVNAATAALDAAQKQFDLKLAGASNEQIRSQEAAVQQARAGVAAASAQYEKTIIRSPISGTVAAISVKYGELLSPGSTVAMVVNKGGLQIKTYISEGDLALVSQDAEVEIGDTGIKGKVVRMSPSINPQTRGVEVQVGVIDPDKSGLVVGQNQQVKIKTNNASTGTGFRLPIQAVNIGQTGAYVFTVKDDETLEQHQVETGIINGEQVEIKSGLTSDMKIVSTVYELKAGQKVKVQ